MNKNIWILGGLALVIILVLNANPRFVTHSLPSIGIEKCECRDGEPVDHVGNWFEESFPTFYDEFEELCNGDYFDGTFVSIANTMGCTDADLFYYMDCTDAPLLSAQEVCETIGGTWSCYPDAGCDSDECEEPNAVLMCEI